MKLDSSNGPAELVVGHGSVRRSDAGWSWVVLVASFTTFAIFLGQMYAFHIYFVVFLRDFEAGRSDTAWVGSLNLAFLQIGAIFCGLYKVHLGARLTTVLGGIIGAIGYVASSFAINIPCLMFTYGIVTALGYSMCLCGCLDAVNQYFRRYVYLANGISFAGGGLGLVACGFLVQYLLDEYGWRGSMLLQAGLSLNICVLGCLFFPTDVTTSSASDKNRNQKMAINRVTSADTELTKALKTDDVRVTSLEARPIGVGGTMTWRQRFTNRLVCLLVTSTFLQGIGVFSMYIVYKDMAIFMGFESVFPATMLTLGVGNMVGRGLAGAIMFRMASPILFFSSSTLLCALAISVHLVNTLPEVFVVLGAVFGFAHGSFTSAISITVRHIFGQAEFSNTFGYVLFYAGIGTILGPPLSGLVTDLTQSYFGCLAMSSCFLATAGLCLTVVHFCHTRMLAGQRPKLTEVGSEKSPSESEPLTNRYIYQDQNVAS